MKILLYDINPEHVTNWYKPVKISHWKWKIRSIGQSDRSVISRFIYGDLKKQFKFYFFLVKSICVKKNIRKCNAKKLWDFKNKWYIWNKSSTICEKKTASGVLRLKKTSKLFLNDFSSYMVHCIQIIQRLLYYHKKDIFIV